MRYNLIVEIRGYRQVHELLATSRAGAVTEARALRDRVVDPDDRPAATAVVTQFSESVLGRWEWAGREWKWRQRESR